jgi:hypothetical protein
MRKALSVPSGDARSAPMSKQVILHPRQQAVISVGGMGAGDAKGRIGFINRADGLNPQIVFRAA